VIPQDAGFPEPTPNAPAVRPAVGPVIGRIDPQGYYPPEPMRVPAGLTAPPDLGGLLQALRHRWMAAVALGVPLAAAAAIAAWMLLAPKSTAFVVFRVLSTPPDMFNVNPTGRYDFPTYIRTVAGQLKSRQVVNAALKSDDVRRLNLERNHPEPALYVEEELKTEFTELSEMLTLSMSSTEPTEAIGVVKGVANSFLENIIYAEHRRRQEELTQLKDAYSKENSELLGKKDALKKLADAAGTTDRETLSQQQVLLLDSQREANTARNSIATDLLKARADLKAIETTLETLRDLKVPEPDIEAALRNDLEAKTMEKRIKDLESLLEDYGTNSLEPTAIRGRSLVKRLKTEYEDHKNKLVAQVKRSIEKRDLTDLELRRKTHKDFIATLEEELAKREKVLVDLREKVARIGTTTRDIEALRSEISTKEKFVAELGSRLERQTHDVEQNPERVRLSQEAELQKKDAKKQIAGAVAAPMLVLFGVCMSLALAEHRQRRVRTAVQVADGLGIRVVGAVPALARPERHLIGANAEPEAEAAPVLESYDAIRTLLLHEAEVGSSRVVLVTSAVAGEGKTTLASHLATSLARAGRKTLLLDGDLRSPAVHQLFDVPLQPGFSEVLLGEVEVSDAAQGTTLPGLAVMPAGQWDREVLQALARGGLEGIIEKLKEEFDFIVIDSHPVLAAADALLLAQRSDAVLVSVLREVSQTPRVYAAVQRLEALGVYVLGAVVNAATDHEAFANPGRAATAAAR
jgi:capsular exopolysaccharide synthesis family protein